MKLFQLPKLLLALGLVACGTTAGVCQNSEQDKSSPNVVIIYCDDMGWGDLGCFGHPSIKTPHLDRMAEEGQKWTQFYVADPVCTPSRAALLTGRYPYRTGMTSPARGVLFPDSEGGLPQSEVTIAELLKQKNYATGMVGKWHLGHLPQHLPRTQGFDSYYGIPYSNDMDFVAGSPNYRAQVQDPDFYPEVSSYNVPLIENEEIIEQPCDQTTITRRYTERAVKFIKDKKDEPFFLYLAHSLPHIPLFVEESFRGSSKRGLYGDVIQEIDWSVGQVLQTLRELNLDENTLVMFSSDNGPWLSFKDHGGSAGPLRAGKGTTFEGGQRVPTIFWSPGRLPAGVVNEMGSTLDLIPTLAALTGTTVPADRTLDGFDLSPVMLSSEVSPREEFFYWAFGVLHAVRSGPWKLHLRQREEVNYGTAVHLRDPELYHLERDISEKYNLSADHPEVVQRLLTMARDHQEGMSDRLPDNLIKRIGE